MQTLQLARLLREEGLSVDLVQTNAPWSPEFVGKIRGFRALFRLLPYLSKVWRLCGKVDVIHLMANSGWSWQLFAAPVVWIGSLRGVPVIVNYRGGEARQYLNASAPRVKPTLEKASTLVVPSAFLQKVFSEFGVSASVIPNIIDLETFKPSRVPSHSSVFTIVITRNLEPIYGIETAIRAMAVVSEKESGVVLKIAGSGPQREELRQLVSSLSLGKVVEFVGRLDRPSVARLYQSADVMINPSRVDNMPNSVLEALASGVPVISTDVGGVPYIVKHETTALLTPVDDALELAEAILRLHSDSVLRERLIENGLQQVKQYAWDRVREQWLDLYDSAVRLRQA